MILIVDDKPENLIALKKALESRNFKIDTALSGEEALKKILDRDYNLIILDVQMPGMDGFEVAEAMSGYSKTKDIPIIFLSAVNVSKQFITQGYETGGRDYLVKPFDTDILVLKIRTFIKLHQQTIELKNIQKTLTDEIEMRKIAEHKKDEFISIASHELNTPLTVLKGYLQLSNEALKNNEVEESRLYLSKLGNQVEKLHGLVIDLLDITKIESGKLQFIHESFNFESFIENIQQNFQFTHPGIRIIKNGVADINILGDKNRLEQVLQNYISNAIKYTKEKKDVKIFVQITENKEIEVSVRDEGIGISKEKQAQIFDKFYRVQEDSVCFQGLGLGLYICAEIIKAHKGEYGVNSEEGKGSTFYFRIPINHQMN